MLKSQPEIARGIDAFPRVQSGDSVSADVAAKINASLQRLDANVRNAARGCREQLQENQPRRSVGGWKRTVTVTMKGPSFLSIDAADSVFCGGAHPDIATFSMVYDLDTGRPVDWTKLLPSEVRADTDQGADGTTIGLIAWKALRERAIHDADSECRDALSEAEGLSFSFSLNARKGVLAAAVYGLPYAVAACAHPLEVSPEQANRLGISSRVIDALVAAKQYRSK